MRAGPTLSCHKGNSCPLQRVDTHASLCLTYFKMKDASKFIFLIKPLTDSVVESTWMLLQMETRL